MDTTTIQVLHSGSMSVLVAILFVDANKYKVIELPPQSLNPQKSKRTFVDYDRAEVYRDSQYDEDTFVFAGPEDIEEEIERRKVLLAKESPDTRLRRQGRIPRHTEIS
jgi:hypothetical protein